MLRYICYFFAPDNCLFARHEFDAQTEREALATAREAAAAHQNLGLHSFEVWEGFRFISAEVHRRAGDTWPVAANDPSPSVA